MNIVYKSEKKLKITSKQISYETTETKPPMSLLPQFMDKIKKPRITELTIKELIENFIEKYESLYSKHMTTELELTPEAYERFKRELRAQFIICGVPVEKIEESLKDKLLENMDSWIDPELFNLHPTKSGNRLVSGVGIKYINGRFSSIFPQVPGARNCQYLNINM